MLFAHRTCLPACEHSPSVARVCLQQQRSPPPCSRFPRATLRQRGGSSSSSSSSRVHASMASQPGKESVGRPLASVLQDNGASPPLAAAFSALEGAVKRVALAVRRAGLDDVLGYADAAAPAEAAKGRDRQKKLDVVANELFKEALAGRGLVAFLASEEDDGVVAVDASASSSSAAAAGSASLAVVMDPLDGSRNIEASMPTGSIFGFYAVDSEEAAERWRRGETPAGRQLIAAAYALYSSATALVVSLGRGTQGFILDPTTNAFLLTQPSIRVPERGQIYSLNDARYPDWPPGLRRYIDAVRAGKGRSSKQYSARYVCALVADVHRSRHGI